MRFNQGHKRRGPPEGRAVMGSITHTFKGRLTTQPLPRCRCVSHPIVSSQGVREQAHVCCLVHNSKPGVRKQGKGIAQW